MLKQSILLRTMGLLLLALFAVNIAQAVDPPDLPSENGTTYTAAPTNDYDAPVDLQPIEVLPRPDLPNAVSWQSQNYDSNLRPTDLPQPDRVVVSNFQDALHSITSTGSGGPASCAFNGTSVTSKTDDLTTVDLICFVNGPPLHQRPQTSVSNTTDVPDNGLWRPAWYQSVSINNGLAQSASPHTFGG